MLFPKGAFDQDTVSIMGRALDEAWSQVERATFFPDVEAAIAIKSAMAKSIMLAAADGEIDPRILSQRAIEAAGRETL
jgi:hypothetical protein